MKECPRKNSCSHCGVIMSLCPKSHPCDEYYESCHYYRAEQKVSHEPEQSAKVDTQTLLSHFLNFFTGGLKALRSLLW